MWERECGGGGGGDFTESLFSETEEVNDILSHL